MHALTDDVHGNFLLCHNAAKSLRDQAAPKSLKARLAYE